MLVFINFVDIHICLGTQVVVAPALCGILHH